MKNKKNILIKLLLLAMIAMSIPAVSSSPTFTCYANLSIETDGSGDGDPSDNGGTKPVEAPKGGSVLDQIVDTVKTVLGGLVSGGGSGSTDSSHNG